MFWEKDAYVIAKKLTNNHELHRDLVSFVFILLHKYEQTNKITSGVDLLLNFGCNDYAE